jgi:hypothetical protein
VEPPAVDAGRAAGDDRYARGDSEDHAEQLRARLRRVLLRVVQSTERPHVCRSQALKVEENGRRHERSGERAAARFVCARHEADAERPIEGE